MEGKLKAVTKSRSSYKEEYGGTWFRRIGEFILSFSFDIYCQPAALHLDFSNSKYSHNHRLSAFSGGPLEGTYVYNPSQMKVDYPLNADDEDITSTGELRDLPLSVPTSMTHFIHRIRLAELCREAVDTMPSILLDNQAANYDVVLALHSKFQNYIQQIPIFFRLDVPSIQQSRDICRDRPYIAWQRALLHFSFNTRLCRLHRSFHLEGLTDPRYSFSRVTCSSSAQTVLELRRSC